MAKLAHGPKFLICDNSVAQTYLFLVNYGMTSQHYDLDHYFNIIEVGFRNHIQKKIKRKMK